MHRSSIEHALLLVCRAWSAEACAHVNMWAFTGHGMRLNDRRLHGIMVQDTRGHTCEAVFVHNPLKSLVVGQARRLHLHFLVLPDPKNTRRGFRIGV